MDEESPKKKISVNSFFEKVDSIEKVASSALSKSDSVMGVANANKLLVESLQLTVETMQTEIRDIANYIIVENKLEKDLKEDRLLEEQDAQQKKDISKKFLDLKAGPQGPKGPQGVKGEDFGGKGGGGGSLLGTLLKLGSIAALVKFIAPTILPLAGKFVFKTLLPALGKAFVGGFTKLGGFLAKGFTGTLGKLPLIGKGITSFGKGIVSNFGKIGKTIAALLTGILGVSGGGGGAKSSESNMSLSPTEGGVDADDKEVEPEKKENKILEFVKKGGVAGYLGRKMFGDKKDDTTEKKLDTRFDEDTGRAYVNGQEVDVEKYNEFKSLSPEQQAEQGLDFFKEDKEEIKPEKKENKLLEFVKGGGLAGMAYRKVFGKNDQVKPVMESNEVGSLEIPKVDQTNNSNNTTQNVATQPPPSTVNDNTALVQASAPQVSSAMIKPTEAPIPFRKLISSKKYLSVSDMSKSGLPPEIAKMIS